MHGQPGAQQHTQGESVPDKCTALWLGGERSEYMQGRWCAVSFFAWAALVSRVLGERHALVLLCRSLQGRPGSSVHVCGRRQGRGSDDLLPGVPPSTAARLIPPKQTAQPTRLARERESCGCFVLRAYRLVWLAGWVYAGMSPAVRQRLSSRRLPLLPRACI